MDKDYKFSTFGWELLYHCSKNEIKTPKDLAFVLVHFVLIKNDFRCVGDEAQILDACNASELLPPSWNQVEERSVQYVRKELKYTLRTCNPNEESVIFNLIDEKNGHLSCVIIKLEDLKRWNESPQEIALENIDLLKTVKSELVQKLVGVTFKNAESMTEFCVGKPRILGDGQNQGQFYRNPHCGSQREQQVDPFFINVGRSDLCPFAGPGSGMLAQLPPVRPDLRSELGVPRVPRCNAPPGARYDPFGPPDNDMTPFRPFNPDDFYS